MPRSNHTLWQQGGEATHGLDQGVFISWRFTKIQLVIADPDICCPYHRKEKCQDNSSVLEGDQRGRREQTRGARSQLPPWRNLSGFLVVPAGGKDLETGSNLKTRSSWSVTVKYDDGPPWGHMIAGEKVSILRLF